MEGDPFQNVIGISSNGINNETKRLEECVFGSTNFVKSSINSQKPDCKNAQFEKPSAWRDEDDDDEDESQRLAKKRAFEEAFKNKSNWAQKRADPEDEYKNSTHTYHSVDSALLPPRKLVYTNIKDLNKSNTDLARINSLEFHPSNPIAFISTNKHMLELYQLQEKNHKIISQLNVADFKAQFSHFVGTDQIMFTSTTNKCYLVYHMPESRIVKHPFIKGVDTFTRNADLMGRCKATLHNIASYQWARLVDGDDRMVECRWDLKRINISSGFHKLKQHESYECHRAAVSALASQPTMERSLASSSIVFDAQAKIRRATIIHVLSIVVNKQSFRSSDSACRKRSRYAKMFPDSSFTAINCGRTKASYIAVKAAPFARQQLCNDYKLKLFGIHLDETSYNGKCRLEFWIVYFKDGERKTHYLTTVELSVNLEAEEFLKQISSVKHIDDVKLQDANSVFGAFKEVLARCELDWNNLVYVMTDNCSTMTGRQGGFKAKAIEYCPRIIDFPGCSSHQAHLLQKSEAKQLGVLANVVKMVESFSNFVATSPKAQSILKKCQNLLDLRAISGYSSTRFLSFYQSLEMMLDQFEIVSNLVKISGDENLKAVTNRFKNIEINMDQALIHIKPIYVLTKITQDPNLDIHDQLKHLLLICSQLLSRMGYSEIDLKTSGYLSKLYTTSATTNKRLPARFPSKTTALYHSGNPLIRIKMSKLNSAEEKDIMKQWNNYNEIQLEGLLKRFLPFLVSPLTRFCYTLFTSIDSMTDRHVKHLQSLSGFLHIPPTETLDEFTVFKFACVDKSATLKTSFVDNDLDAFMNLRNLVESVLVVCCHNMTVESGFSCMKSTETDYSSGLTPEVYDSLRIIQEYWHRDTYESFNIPAELDQMVQSASRQYRQETKVKKQVNSRKRAYAEELRSELHVFKRKTPLTAQKDLRQTEDELERAERLVEELRQRKAALEENRDSSAIAFMEQL